MIIVNREYLDGLLLLLLLLLLSLLLSLKGEAPVKRKKVRQKKKGKQEIEFQPSRQIGRFLLIAFEKVVTSLKFYSAHKWEQSY